MENSEEESNGADPVSSGWLQTLFARRGVFGVFFVVIAGTVFLAALVKLYLSPTEYLGSVVVEFRPAEGERPDFEREVEIMKTRGVLGGVEKDLKLSKQWAMTPLEAVDALRTKIEVESLSSPQVARISVYHTEAMLAARIADALPAAYARHKARKGLESTAYHEEALKRQIDELTFRKDAAFDAWDMEARRFGVAPARSAEDLAAASAELLPSQPSTSNPRVLDSGFMIEAAPGLPIAAEEASHFFNSAGNSKVEQPSVGEAEYERLLAEIEKPQSALADYGTAIGAVPPPLLVHEAAVIPSDPARPVVEVEMKNAGRRAIGFGLLGGLLGMLLIPAWNSGVRVHRLPPRPPTGATVAGTKDY